MMAMLVASRVLSVGFGSVAADAAAAVPAATAQESLPVAVEAGLAALAEAELLAVAAARRPVPAGQSLHFQFPRPQAHWDEWVPGWLRSWSPLATSHGG